MNPRLISGLYAIVDTECLGAERVLPATEAALAAGVRLFQYRDKLATPEQRLQRCLQLLRPIRRQGGVLIVNDDVAVALECGAHGVHLGEDDATLAQAREQLGPLAIIGASCYNSVVNAQRAAQAGASYLAFGAFFPSPTKPQARVAHPALLGKARAFGLPLVAIGGITPDNGGELLRAGADALAVISGLWQSDDLAAQVQRYRGLFGQGV